MRSFISMRNLVVIFFSMAILFSFATTALADPPSPPSPDISLGQLFAFDRDHDTSFNLLRSIFGNTNGILQDKRGVEAPPNVFNLLFFTFNQIMMALATLLLIYTFFLGIINTAHEGQFMGQKMHSLWVPIRAVAGYALIIPYDSGYSTIQLFMMWIVVCGIGAAHQIWDKAMAGIVKLGVAHAVPLPPDQSTYSTNLQNLLANNYCAQMVYSDRMGKTDLDLDKTAYSYSPSIGATVRSGYSFGGCYSPIKADPKADPPLAPPTPVFTRSVTGGTAPITQADQCPDNLPIFLDCGSFERTSNGDGTVIISDTLFSNMAKSFSNAGNELAFRPPPPGTLISSNPVVAAAGDISRNVQNKQIAIARQVDVVDEKASSAGWADAGAYFFKFTEKNGELAQLTNWDQQGLSVRKCAVSNEPYGTDCQEGNSVAENYQIPPGTGTHMEKFQDSSGTDWSAHLGDHPEMIVNVITNVIVRAYCVILFGDVNPENLYSTDGSGKPYVPPGSHTTDKENLHPLFWVQIIGHRLVMVAEYTWGIVLIFSLIAAVVSNFCSATMPFAGVFSFVSRAILTPLFLLIGMIFSIGLTMEVYIPIIPYVIFTFGVIGWLICALETVLAAPLVALGITYPEGQEMMSRADPAIMLLVNVFIRPTFMIFGLIAGLLISKVAVGFLNHSFSAITNLTSDKNQTGIGGFELIMFLAIYVSFVIAILNKSFGLIASIPDNILRWIGNQAQFGEYTKGGEESIKQAASGAAGAASEGLKGTAGGAQKALGDSMSADSARKEKAKETYDSENKGGEAISKQGKANATEAQKHKTVKATEEP